MNEQINDWEQPNNPESTNVAEASNDESVKMDNGSQFGKFNDAKSLLSAYNSLQAEFTKKCQKLSELTKSQQEEVQNQNIPVFEKQDWTNKVSSFLKENAGANDFAMEISKLIMENDDLKTNPNALELAWAKIIKSQYISPKQLSEDEVLIEKIINENHELKQKLMKSFVEKNQQKTPPPLSSSSGGTMAFYNATPTSSMQEAKKLVEDMFNVKGDK